jgi:general secretion pathway protein A
MLLKFYKLSEQPFGVTPDSRFLYMGVKHREALTSLVYGTESNRGFLAMIAEPGMGKTSLLYKYLSELGDKARAAFVFWTDCNPREFIQRVLMDFGVDTAGMDLPTMHDKLNRLVTKELQAGRRVVLAVDEAQNLEEKTLETIRLLSNFETPWMKLMMVVLAGQPKLANNLDSPPLSQLRQRISMVIRIEPFTHEEVDAYIDHRLWVAGGKKPGLFTLGARKLIAEGSGGIPRNVNNLCFNAMSLGYALRRETIDRDIITKVIADLDLAPLKGRSEAIAELDPVLKLAGALKDGNKNKFVADLSPACVNKRQNIAVRKSDEQPKQFAAPRTAPAKEKANARAWVSRFAIASLLFLAAVSSIGYVNRFGSRVFKVPPSAVAPVSGSSIPTKTAEAAPGPSRVAGDFVRVMPGQTLYQICFAKFGRYDVQMFQKLRLLNPWMTDPNVLESGRELFVPSSLADPGDVQQAVKNASSSPTAE